MAGFPGVLHIGACGARFSGASSYPESWAKIHDLGKGDDPRYPRGLWQDRRCSASFGEEKIRDVVSYE